jgi:ABC-type antimicrobial peptide transport system permease subunit
VRLAIGSEPRQLLQGVLSEGTVIAGAGIVTGAVGGLLLAWAAGGYFTSVTLPEALPLTLAAIVLVGAAIMASLVPAARAARIDVMQALRDE